jgi:hypothetical protein
MNPRQKWAPYQSETLKANTLSFLKDNGETISLSVTKFGEKCSFSYLFADTEKLEVLNDKYKRNKDFLYDRMEYGNNRCRDNSNNKIICNNGDINVIWRLIETIAADIDIIEILPRIRNFLQLDKELKQAPEISIDVHQRIAQLEQIVAKQAKDIDALRSELARQYQQPPSSPGLFR